MLFFSSEFGLRTQCTKFLLTLHNKRVTTRRGSHQVALGTVNKSDLEFLPVGTDMTKLECPAVGTLSIQQALQLVLAFDDVMLPDGKLSKN